MSSVASRIWALEFELERLNSRCRKAEDRGREATADLERTRESLAETEQTLGVRATEWEQTARAALLELQQSHEAIRGSLYWFQEDRTTGVLASVAKRVAECADQSPTKDGALGFDLAAAIDGGDDDDDDDAGKDSKDIEVCNFSLPLELTPPNLSSQDLTAEPASPATTATTALVPAKAASTWADRYDSDGSEDPPYEPLCGILAAADV